MSTATATIEPLTALDRCDRCIAAAVVRFTLTTGGELQFCGHHGAKHAPALSPLVESVLTRDEVSVG